VKDRRKWTIYIAQDKHLDYNWCGTHAEIETRMASLLDYYLVLAERGGHKWNIDCTLWLEVYRRQRGEEGARQLLEAIKRGSFGYGASYSVLLWGIMSTELSLRGLYHSAAIREQTGTRNETVLIMENRGLPWGLASLLADAGFKHLARGTYPLRAESYDGGRTPLPLFRWKAQNGKEILVSWPPYVSTGKQGGYAEAYELAAIAGEKWDALSVRDFGDRNTDEIYRKRVEYIRETVRLYESYGDDYPVSCIMLLGSGWDNWTRTEDLYNFIKLFNKREDDGIRLKDARYDEYFGAVSREVEEKGLRLPEQAGSFGICWDEWAAYLANSNKRFRRAERLVRVAEAQNALDLIEGRETKAGTELLDKAWTYLLDFAEHDMGGTDRLHAAISAGVRADFSTRALAIAGSLGTLAPAEPGPSPRPARNIFEWNGWTVKMDGKTGALISLLDDAGRQWACSKVGLGLGSYIHSHYGENKRLTVFPPPATDKLRGPGLTIDTGWRFHEDGPWIDLTVTVTGAWTGVAQSLQVAFPLNITDPVYYYDMAGTVLRAGTADSGGDDLPGANTELYSAVSFAAVSGEGGTLLLLTPDSHLVQFGTRNVRVPGFNPAKTPACVTALPMMNFTPNDHQLNQGGDTGWVFSYRMVFLKKPFDPLAALEQAQKFAAPPFISAGKAAASPVVKKLGIRFAGAVTAVKVARDGKRLILRFWNPSASCRHGSLKLPRGYTGAETCDALEEPRNSLPTSNGAVAFTVPPRTILTIAATK
jgi:hypothetical protein